MMSKCCNAIVLIAVLAVAATARAQSVGLPGLIILSQINTGRASGTQSLQSHPAGWHCRACILRVPLALPVPMRVQSRAPGGGPKINGYEICRQIRKDGLDMPTIMLTAKGQESDIVLGLNLGADDYVTKPFNISELLARAEAFLRRAGRNETKAHQFGPYDLDFVSRRLLRDGVDIALTPKEFDLLALFVRRSGRALTRDEILRCVCGMTIRWSHHGASIAS